MLDVSQGVMTHDLCVCMDAFMNILTWIPVILLHMMQHAKLNESVNYWAYQPNQLRVLLGIVNNVNMVD